MEVSETIIEGAMEFDEEALSPRYGIPMVRYAEDVGNMLGAANASATEFLLYAPAMLISHALGGDRIGSAIKDRDIVGAIHAAANDLPPQPPLTFGGQVQQFLWGSGTALLVAANAASFGDMAGVSLSQNLALEGRELAAGTPSTFLEWGSQAGLRPVWEYSSPQQAVLSFLGDEQATWEWLPGANDAPKSFIHGEYLPGMGAYKDVGGHHPLSAKAFAYQFRDEAMAIGKVEMGLTHPQPLTSLQQQGYIAFGLTGEPLTITRMAQIEVDAMVMVGIPREYAKKAVCAAIWERFANEQFTPTFIPWVGPNPGVNP
jgi:hypothetical protein